MSLNLRTLLLVLLSLPALLVPRGVSLGWCLCPGGVDESCCAALESAPTSCCSAPRGSEDSPSQAKAGDCECCHTLEVDDFDELAPSLSSTATRLPALTLCARPLPPPAIAVLTRAVGARAPPGAAPRVGHWPGVLPLRI